MAEGPPSRCDVAIVGGGILGLAVAREMVRRSPRRSVCLLEREPRLGAHQTGHNSGVIHAGVYYVPGSLKAKLCVEGARELYEYCEEKGIPHERCGKVIVAVERGELLRLEELERRGRANGVPGLRRLDAAGIHEVEPHATGLAGLYSPHTGIVDFGIVAAAYAEDFRAGGGVIATSCEVEAMSPVAHSLRIRHSQGVTEAANAICCAGAWSDRIAVAAGASPDPRIVPFRGAYMRLVAARRRLVRALIYPVPDPSLPFLGIHLTRTVEGEVLIGPSALLAAARDAYRPSTVRARDLFATLSWPGSWRVFRRWWRTGLTEMRQAASRRAFVAAAARYLPELGPGDIEPSFAGVRAQAVNRAGGLVDDFIFSATERALHVRNAPSPAATSSLAIARRIVDESERSL